MKRVLIKYAFVMKNGIKGESQLYASIAYDEPQVEALYEARRDFYEDHGFSACFDVLALDILSVVAE